MCNEEYKMLFKSFGLPVYGEDEDIEVPFEDIEETKTKEEIYAYIRCFAKALQEMGAGPYTMFTFKEQCNSLARKGAEWEKYLGLCCKYAERQMRFAKPKPVARHREPETFESQFWVL